MTENPTQRRALAMTFDDLPLQELWPPNEILPPLEVLCELHKLLLETISANKIPAVGFVNEKRLHDYADVNARRKVLAMWLDAGLKLGNHTFSHVVTETTSLTDYCDDVVRGEKIVAALLAERDQKLTYFRHPQLHTGPNRTYKESLERFLAGRAYRLAPVTIKHQDWAFAIPYSDAMARGDHGMSEHIARQYMVHLEACCEFFEKLSVDILGYELKQVLLLHVNELNAECLPSVIAMLRGRGYEFLSLDEALTDEAYQLPDDYVGIRGPSWLHRWAFTKGIAVPEEPRQPQFLKQLLEKITRQAKLESVKAR